MPVPIDRSGEVIGNLTVIERVPPTTTTKSAHWRCRSECGRELVVSSTALNHKKERNQHCGCLGSRLVPGAKNLTPETRLLSQATRYELQATIDNDNLFEGKTLSALGTSKSFSRYPSRPAVSRGLKYLHFECKTTFRRTSTLKTISRS
jgi:hypothetical protein